MAQYRIRIDQPIDADTPEEAAETFRSWLRLQDRDDLYSPIIEVAAANADGVFEDGDELPMDIAVFEWWDQTQKEHMHAYVEHFDDSPDMTEDEAEQNRGWYARLSAPGYLDCTEWDGPHETQYLAMESLYNMHGE